MSNYTQGHSDCTTATHQRRTAETDAAFLLPHIKPTDKILDVGCGPGTITAGFVSYVPQGSVIGLDISAAVLQKARDVATDAGTPAHGPGSLGFGEGDILKGLPYEDNTFDIVFSSQVIGHMVPPDQPLAAITEMRRVVRPGGIVACRDAAFQHFYPAHLDLDRLWVGNMNKVIYKGVSPSEVPGFNVDGGKVVLGAGTMVHSGPEKRKWLAWRAAGQLKEGDAFRQSWLDAGMTKEAIEETLEAIGKWCETEDAWFAALQCEMLGWK
ncbi:hypothetical protein LTR78_010667 [Recurvomyces mirabilis]|uniref:Methyltransferase domain-containing protein n=1 Tax=Recurvomyces mirabilis TaxID=574656 RepID=A0AAE0TPM5_9PEZI|nr:hypothetical protein LTR78_010667 [Recurvomyces mirabilis]KAK5149536.1 hypothetical protein LTS14_010862 [Recurvomyces mirabilis]